jgi:hypothetical protein
MRKHNGMRPQDIPIVLKIVALNGKHWNLAELSKSLTISISEISESLNRSKLANLIDHTKKKINRQNLLDFLEFGVSYVFPQQPGTMSRGIPTAHSHPSIKEEFVSELSYVWPDSKGTELGLVIEPFYPKQTDGIFEDAFYYELLALVDVIRVGKVREVKFAVKELKKLILDGPSH